MPQPARPMKNVNFSLFSNDCVFNHISSVIVLFALVTKNYCCLFMRTFILIDCGKSRVAESTYMVMFMKTDFPVLRYPGRRHSSSPTHVQYH